MKRINAKRAMMVGTVALFAAAAVGGPLTPPGGSVTSTHKTLSEVEPRTAVNATNTPATAGALYTISQSGSYYLTGNIDVSALTATSAIRIAASNVTLDLSGCTIIGAPANTSTLIMIAGGGPGSLGNITIQNGTVRNSGGMGINATTSSVPGVRLVDVAARNNAFDGISLFDKAVVERCIASNNGNSGFTAGQGSVFVNCVADGNTVNGFATGAAARLTDCVATTNQNVGFSLLGASQLNGCIARGSLNTEFSINGDGCVFSNCIAENLAGFGNGFSGGNRHTYTNCVATSGGGSVCFSVGMGSSLQNCTASGGGGFSASGSSTFNNCAANTIAGNGFSVGINSTVTNCSAGGCTGFGILATTGSTVSGNSCYLNGSDGIRVSSGVLVTNNNCRGNTGFGILCTGSDNRLEGNNLTSNTAGGISVTGGCFVARNTARGQGINDFVISGSNAVGQIFDVTAGATITTGNSFANFRY